jgi:hypothetical protein
MFLIPVVVIPQSTKPLYLVKAERQVRSKSCIMTTMHPRIAKSCPLHGMAARIFVLSLTYIGACADDPNRGSQLFDDTQALFQQRCAGGACHIGYTDIPAGNLDLTPGTVCSQLVDVPALEVPGMVRVLPGDASASYLYCKLDPACTDRPAGATLMPLGAPDGLPASDLELVARWIAQGSPGCIDETAPVFAGATAAVPLPSAVELSWEPAADDITSGADIVYLAYQADTPGGQDFAQPTAESAPGASALVIGGLPRSTTLYFVVRARDAAGNIDGNTMEVSATTPDVGDSSPPIFNGVQGATAIGSSGVNLTWQPASDDATPVAEIRYRVYVAETSGAQDFAAATVESDPGATEILVTGHTPATEYFFVVRALDTVGNEDQNTIEMAITTGDSTSFSADIVPIFQARCTNVGCHGGVMPAQQLDLRAQNAYSQLVNVQSTQCAGRTRVTPSQLDASYLANKITGVDMCFGSQMPKGSVMGAVERQLILDWVTEGALDN